MLKVVKTYQNEIYLIHNLFDMGADIFKLYGILEKRNNYCCNFFWIECYVENGIRDRL